MFDSHCHLDFAAFQGEREAVWARARRAGVTGLVLPAYGPDGWDGVLATAGALQGVHGALGIHPWALGELDDGAVERALGELPERLEQDRAVAVGECGLDGVVARRGGASLERQREVFEAQVRVARALELPLIVHAVRAHGPTLEVLKAQGPLPAGGVLHGFGGPGELVRDYAALGLSFSFSPAVAREDHKRMREAARVVPDGCLLVESDGPDQSLPERSRGEPADVALVCEALAGLRDAPLAELKQRSDDNARRLFRL